MQKQNIQNTQQKAYKLLRHRHRKGQKNKRYQCLAYMSVLEI